jgi:hypothetical protein
MSASCCDQIIDPHRGDEKYRRVLAINVAMFAIEVAAGLAALRNLGLGVGQDTRVVEAKRNLARVHPFGARRIDPALGKASPGNWVA